MTAAWWQGRIWAMAPDALEALLALRVDLSAMEDYEHREEPHEPPYAVQGRVATIRVRGALTAEPDIWSVLFGGGACYASIKAAVQAADADPAVETILLDVDSPGGEVSGVHDLATAVANCRKRVVAYASGDMASAAYWLIAGADEIVASPTARVGSIGVYATLYDDSGALDQMGVKRYRFVSSGAPRKVPDPASDTGRDEYQRQVDDLADVFVGWVRQHRGEAVDLADGGVLVGQRALAAGLVDRVDTTPIPSAEGDSLWRHSPGGPPHPRAALAPADGRLEASMPDTQAGPRLDEATARAAEERAAALTAEVAALTKARDDAARQAAALTEALATEKAAREAEAAGRAQAQAVANDLAARVAALEAAERDKARDALLRETMARGAIATGDAAAWEARYDKAPDLVAEILRGLPDGAAVPVAAQGRRSSEPELARQIKTRADVERLADEIQARDKCTYAQAWRRAKEEHPEAQAILRGEEVVA